LQDDWASWEIEILKRELPNKDVSYRAIGLLVGRTRNAVCAKVQRMGLGRGRPVEQVVKKPQVRKMPPLPPSADVQRILARHRAEAATRTLVALTDLADSQCHFPVGDPKKDRAIYCGQPVQPGLAYCPSCVSRVYTPPEVQRVVKPVSNTVRLLVRA